MPDEFFTAEAGDDHDPRVLWSGRCAVAEYAFDEPNSLPRWTLPEETEVVVTDDRVVYRDVATGAAGELHWPWPQHLRVQPGNRATGRAATVTQIQLVCAGPGGTFPALVFAGGDLAAVGDADRLANVLRQAIARYRVEHAAELGMEAPQVRMLSRQVIGPEFSNYLGGEGQTVTLLGSVTVGWPAAQEPEPYEPAAYEPAAYEPEPLTEEPFLDPYFTNEPPAPAEPPTRTAPPVLIESIAPTEPYLPTELAVPAAASLPAESDGWPVAGGADFDGTPAHHEFEAAAAAPRPAFDPTAPARPRPADEAALHGTPDLAARAADLAAQVAGLVSEGAGLGPLEPQTTNLSAYLGGSHRVGFQPRSAGDEPVEGRAEQIRRTASRLAASSVRGRTAAARHEEDDEPGLPTRQRRRSF
jgi:hypothetical protein